MKRSSSPAGRVTAACHTAGVAAVPQATAVAPPIPAPGGATASRLRALDGLRGIAALVVVLNHCALTFPSVAQAMLRPREQVAAGSITWLLTRTPAYLAIAGHEAVFTFFVLSGLVLAIPRLKAVPEPWRAYYPSRLVRLYLPVIAALVLAWVGFQLVPRHLDPHDSLWLQNAHLSYSPAELLRDGFLLAFVSGTVSPLWSLTYEMWFSLLLPAYIWAARGWPRAPWSLLACTVAGLACATGIGSGSPLFRLQYILTFALGVVLAMRREQVRAWCHRLAAAPAGRAVLVGLFVLAVALVALRQELVGLGVDILLAERFDVLVILGCALLLVLETMAPLGQRILETPVVQRLGAISFSLYLVHEPLVIACHELLRADNPWIVPAVAIPLSLLVAECFRRWVETPSHALARRVRARMRAGVGP